MHLSTFIRAEMSVILSEWTTFARKNAPAATAMSTLALTDHAQGILCDIASDIETHQSKQQQFEKSQGEALDPNENTSAAAIHGRLRQASNFSLLQLSSEFRALRATVLRLWLPNVQHMSATTMDEMVRFNEAIDQAMAESIVTYSARADRTRDLFLAVLGHDLRAPLATMSLAGDLLTHPATATAQAATIGHNVKRSARHMSAMVTDLLGFTRIQMGVGMPITRTCIDVQALCEAAAADAQAMYPGSAIAARFHGLLSESVDGVRLQQLVTNLLINAAQHSAKGSPITLEASGADEAITIKVGNRGPVIPAASLETIFQPLVQLESELDDSDRSQTSLGLGLFIAQETTAAHGGTIGVTSSVDDGTVFVVTLPRQP
jgi:signal transduction histidine kinase